MNLCKHLVKKALRRAHVLQQPIQQQCGKVYYGHMIYHDSPWGKAERTATVHPGEEKVLGWLNCAPLVPEGSLQERWWETSYKKV